MPMPKVPLKRKIPNQSAANETFLEVQERLEIWIANQVRNGLGREEAETIGHDAFLYAYEKFDPNRGATFTTLVGLKFHCGVKDYWRQRSLSPIPQSDFSAVSAKTPTRDWASVRSELGSDAATVSEMALNPTAPIACEALERSETNCLGMWRNLGFALRESLREMGWSQGRIREAIEELFRVISQ